jgi:small subunit ribosomal protein S12
MCLLEKVLNFVRKKSLKNQGKKRGFNNNDYFFVVYVYLLYKLCLILLSIIKKTVLIFINYIMPTFHQLTKNSRKPRRYKNKRIALNNCPQKRATCLKVHVITPRKPNSGLRKISRVIFTSNFRRVNAYIPGIGHNTLQKHSSVLVRGGQVKDIPGMKYTIMRGKFDLKALGNRRQARSKYGAIKTAKEVDPRYVRHIIW